MGSFGPAEAVKRARIAAKLTQAELAERAGVTRMTVQQTEAGTKDPRLSTLVVLFRALGLEMMVVPVELRGVVDDFIRSGGRIVGQPVTDSTPLSIVDELTRTIPSAKR